MLGNVVYDAGKNGETTAAMKSLKPYIKVMRPTQWVKNGFVLMPLIFSSHLFNFEYLVKVFGMLFAFCCVSSATYVFNDYMDRDQDRVHPLKRFRPIASGQVSPVEAFVLTCALVAGAVLLAWAIQAPIECYVLLGVYLILHIVYSAKLKDVVILDVLTIAAGFLLRVVGGAVVISVSVSSWLILCTFSVAIFLALGKRRHEVVILCGDAISHRPVLESYSVTLLDQLLQVVTTSTFIFYCLYSVRGTGMQSEKMMFTIPLVTYGIFRYLYLIYQQEDGGSPTALLLTDPPLLTCVIIWLTACIGIIYL
jgi:4-hydroxybenzoate polyprenyltransferase